MGGKEDQLRRAEARLRAASQIIGVPHALLVAVLDQVVQHPELEDYHLSEPIRDYLRLPSALEKACTEWPPVPIFFHAADGPLRD
jgi:hypothetical protein